MPNKYEIEARVSAWRTMLYAHDRLMRQLADELERTENLDIAWYEVLMHIAESHGSITQRELLERTLMGQSGLSRVLTKMEAAELVKRGTVESDRRNLSVELTKRGRERLRRAAPIHVGGIKKWFGDQLSEDEAVAIEAGLGRVLKGLAPQRPDNTAEAATDVATGSAMLSTSTNPVSIADTLVVRDALEPLIVADAARYATRDDVGELRKALATMTRESHDPVSYLRADWRLHGEIAKITPNRVLGSTYAGLLSTLFENVESVGRTEDMRPYLQDRLKMHADLVEAIAQGDVAGAEAIAHKHRLTPDHDTDPLNLGNG
jgi:DNA-binding FadR family transcriptional regulator